MKILKTPDSSWSSEKLVCQRCSTVFEADEEDLDYDLWKTSGYWFNNSAVTEMRFCVKCPMCDDSWVRIDENDIPILLRDKLIADRRKKRAERGY